MKLSICIATLNRAAFIGETLRSIGSQMQDEVEIVVLDGASKDATEQVVRSLQEDIPQLRYVRQDCNRGVDRDYNAAVELATGEYCWLMSDDDLAKPGVVEAVLRAIDNHRYGLIILNSEVRTLTLSQLLDHNRLRFNEDKVYRPEEFERLFEETSAYLSYIGAVVIRRDLWIARDRGAYFGSYFIHVGVIFQAPLPAETLVLAEPYITIRFGNTQWRPREFEIRMVRWTNLVWSLSALSESVRSKCYRREPWRSFKSLVFYRAKGTYSLVEYRNWVRPRVGLGKDRLKALGVALTPGILANLVGLIYCSFDYRDSNIHFLDMKASRYYLGNLLRPAKLSKRSPA
jgi:abequosyltransferase